MFDFFFKHISTILKVKDETIKALSRLGIFSIRDLLFYKPISYFIKNIAPDLSTLEDGMLIQVEVTIDQLQLSSSARSPTRIQVSNSTGKITLIFFNKIVPFIFARLKVGSKHVICGKVQKFDRFFQITHPEFILQKHLESPVEPVYSLTYGITSKQVYSYILQAIKYYELNLESADVSKEIKSYFTELLTSLKDIHLVTVPADRMTIEYKWAQAIKQISYLELLANQAQLALVRTQKKMCLGRMFKGDKKLKDIILTNLGFELTSAQKEVIKEIEEDQCASMQMMRLLQGDVGSGKTLVALLTMCNVIYNDMQTVLMAPTDLLANQHYQFFQKAVASTDIKVGLLTGKIKGKNRKIIMTELENGKIDILIGTHALFQEKVNFKKLGYIVIDEQHRFGVEQRESLINKASLPDILVMTATPIPRSLTLTMFGDLSCSKLKSKPRNRLPIITTVISTSKINDIAKAINQKISAGEKVYWVCPLISAKDNEEENGNDISSVADAEGRFENIAQIYPGIVGLVHGKLRGNLKDEAMLEFKNGSNQILVATSVIEVGIDVADATLIVIENAEKFGLTQLHQLRGRVGRGSIQSHCILLYNAKKISENGRQRLKIMRESEDGFYIAEQDLLLRGSGELLGKRQSGEPQFFFADVARDADILIHANKKTEDTKPSDFTFLQIKLFAQYIDSKANFS